MHKLAVVIGRFQYHELTPGHLAVLREAQALAHEVLVLVGRTPGINTKRDPLSYELRMDMLRDAGPFIVHPLDDHPSDAAWTKLVDGIVGSYATDAILVGGDDCCEPTYRKNGGRFPFHRVEAVPLHATELRKAIRRPSGDQAFRAGVIWAAEQRFTSVFPVVDVLVIRESLGLLGHKSTDAPDKWRLVGGFVDPTDPTLEFAARREAREETGLEVGDVIYKGSGKVLDWRYRGPEGIVSAVFTAPFIFGRVKARDDITDLCWFPLSELRNRIVPEHAHLLELALQ